MKDDIQEIAHRVTSVRTTLRGGFSNRIGLEYCKDFTFALKTNELKEHRTFPFRLSLPGIQLIAAQDWDAPYVFVQAEGRIVGFVKLRHQSTASLKFAIPSIGLAYAPSSWLEPEFRGKGIMRAAYELVLTKASLVNTESQTNSSRTLWQSLARKYPIAFFSRPNTINNTKVLSTDPSPSNPMWTKASVGQVLLPTSYKGKLE